MDRKDYIDRLWEIDKIWKRAPLSQPAVNTPGGETAAPRPSPAARVSPGSLSPPPCVPKVSRGASTQEANND